MLRFIIFPLLFASTASALVAVAPVDIGAKPGVSGDIIGSIGSRSGNTEKDEYSLGARLQYDQGEDYLVWGDFRYRYGEARGQKNEDNAYAHIRYIHTLISPDWNFELFGQLQQDRFRDIQERSLVGGNTRWRFFNESDKEKGYAALGVMNEQIRYLQPLINPTENNTRINSYIAYTLTFAAGSKFNYLGYYQPKTNDLNDYITTHTLELLVPLYGPLNLNVRGNYAYDSNPAVNVFKKDTTISTSLSYKF